MKKIISLFVMFIFLFSIVSINLVKAEESNLITTDAEIEQETEAVIQENIEDSSLEDVGATPDQAGYGLKLGMEKLRLAFTLNKAKKAELSMKLAELRLKEARLMATKDKIEALERAKIEHGKYILLAEKNLEGINVESEDSLETQAEIELKLEAQKQHVGELENLMLIKAQGLTEEQKQKLLSLIEEFRSQNSDLEIKIKVKDETLKTRLKAKGLTEEKINERLKKIGEEQQKKETNIEQRAQHQINQAQKMYDLASRLIEKAQNRYSNQTNSTEVVRDITIELHAKAKAELDTANTEFKDKHFYKSIGHAHVSKKLSALTIASIYRGIKMDLLEKRLGEVEVEIEDEFEDDTEDLTEDKIKELRKKRSKYEFELKEKLRERLKERKISFERRDCIKEGERTNLKSDIYSDAFTNPCCEGLLPKLKEIDRHGLLRVVDEFCVKADEVGSDEENSMMGGRSGSDRGES